MPSEAGRRRIRSFARAWKLKLARAAVLTASVVTTTGLALAGFWLDTWSDWLRWVVGVGVVCIALCGALGGLVLSRAERSTRTERDNLRASLQSAKSTLDALDPARTLEAFGHALFSGSAAWRLTIYAVEKDHGGEWMLRKLLRKSGSEIYEGTGRSRLFLEKSLFRGLPNFDLTNPLQPFFGQSGSLPDRFYEEGEWLESQSKVIGGLELARALAMPSRKYAWCATRDHASGRTLALMAESVDPDGIKVDLLSSPVMSPWLAMHAALAEVPLRMNEVVSEALRSVERDAS